MKQPHLLIEEKDINRNVLLPGDPNRVDLIAEKIDESEIISHNREFKIANGKYRGKDLSVCSTGAGSPSAAIAMEELLRVGVKRVIRVGTCGALQKNIEIGSLIIPTGAAKFEGTTKRYEETEYPSVPSHVVLNDLIDSTKKKGVKPYIGPIVTDDAFYAESEPSRDWEEAKMLAVEMESSTIFTLARRNGIESGAIIAVDGNLVRGEQKGETEEEELPDTTQEAVEKEIEVALESIT